MYIREDIKEKFKNLGAVVARQHMIDKRNWYKGETYKIPFNDLTYFFNIDDTEIGYYNKPCDAIHIFDRPRVWDKSFFSECIEYKLT